MKNVFTLARINANTVFVRHTLLLSLAVIAFFIEMPRPEAQSIISLLGASSGWYSDDTRNASGTDLVGVHLTQHGKPGQTPAAADDIAIAQQLHFEGGPAGSTGGGTVKIIAPTGNPGKSTLGTVNLSGFAPASDLIGGSFTAAYRWYMEPNPTSRTVAFRIGIQSSQWANSQTSFTAIRSGEQTWDLILVNLMATPSANAWNDVSVDKDNGIWYLYGQASNGNWVGIAGSAPPGGSMQKTLADWAADGTWGPILFGAGAKITNVQFGLGSFQQNCNVYVDHLQTTLLNSGNAINFAAPVRVYSDLAETMLVGGYATIQAAIGDATTLDGYFVRVDAGTYAENVTIDKALTLNGANAGLACGSRGAESIIAPASGVPFTVTADGVTINGFEITAPSSPNAINFVNRSNCTLQYNKIHTIGTTVTGQVIHALYYSVGSSAYSNIEISDNCLDNIGSTSLTGFSASAIGILQSASTGVLTGLNIERNAINDVQVNTGNWPTGKIAYGIIINVGGGGAYLTTTGKVMNAEIRNNEISNVSGFIATGIAMEGNTEDAVVQNNSVSTLYGRKVDVRSGGGYDLNALKFENNRYVATCTVENNSFQTNTFTHDVTIGRGYAVANFVPIGQPYTGGTTGPAVLSCNWFGTADYDLIKDQPSLNGKILNKDGCATNFLLFLTDGTDNAPATIGFQPASMVCNGGCPNGGLVTNTNTSVTYCSIQSAIDDPLTANGHTITVSAGIYAENITVNKSLTLNGAKVGVDARGRITGAPDPVVESVIAPSSGIPIELVALSLGSVINGFAVVGTLNGLGAITSSSGPINDIQIRNNHVQVTTGFTAAALFLNDASMDATIDNNEFISASGGGTVHFDTDPFHGLHFTNNNVLRNGAAGGTGLFVDGNRNVGTSTTSRSPLLQGNLFQGFNTGVNGGTRAFQDAQFLENTFTSCAFDGFQGGPKNSNFDRNTFSNNGRYGMALTSFGNMNIDRGAQGTTVQHNFFYNNITADLRASDQGTGTQGTNNITNNNLLSTTAISNAEPDGGTDPINATCNWFGSAASGVIASKIATVAGGITNHTPWLTNGTDDDLITAGFQPVTGSCGGAPVLIASAVPSNSACNIGSITVTFSGGTGPYDIAWTGGGPDMGITSPYMINGLAQGPYVISVTDANGSTATTTATVTVLPCTLISGNIEWHNDVPSGVGVKDATVNLTGAAVGSDLTDVNGDYEISVAATGNFTITPVKNINKLNGITVADATAIQQHVAVVNVITNPYRLVAADVNKSNSISTLDAAIVNQALLGNPAALAQFKTSWRFVPQSYTMLVPPWGFPEKTILTGASGNQPNQNFYGMKTGDIVSTYANPVNFGGNSHPLVLRVKDAAFESGAEVMVECSADQFDDLAAWQFALKFDPTQLQLLEIVPLTALPLAAGHFGTFNISEGEIRSVWSQPTGMFVEAGTPVFQLRFMALQSGGKLNEALFLNDEVLPALAYTAALVESEVELAFYTTTGTNPTENKAAFRLLQNAPNPFVEQTTVGFVLPKACDATLRIFDGSGRLLREKSAFYAAGAHAEVFDFGAEGMSGVLYYELITPIGVLTKKMISRE